MRNGSMNTPFNTDYQGEAGWYNLFDKLPAQERARLVDLDTRLFLTRDRFTEMLIKSLKKHGIRFRNSRAVLKGNSA